MWVPIFFLIVALVANASFLMFEQTRMLNLARTAARQVSINEWTKPQAEQFIRNQLRDPSAYSVSVEPGVDPGDEVVAAVSIHPKDIVIFGGTIVGQIFAQSRIGARVVNIKEKAP